MPRTCQHDARARALEASQRLKLGRSPCLVLLALLLSFSVQCSDPLDLCAPTEANFGFFSKGDCRVTRASFFQGHEWLTWLGNRDLPERERFNDTEVRHIAEGNRRVDWPLELLVHLNNSVVAYLFALTEYIERPEVQRCHFLLSDSNDTPQAFADSVAELERLSIEAVQLWPTERVRALTFIGRANHLLQDSFSAAHAVREPENAAAPWCVRTIKAYIKRKPGFDGPDILYHGAGEDEGASIGHTTPEDSIYREGRDCHEPSGAAEVEACLSPTAQRARLASRNYLGMMHALVGQSASLNDIDSAVHSALNELMTAELDLCP